jgi:hypothetical protein
MQEKTYEIFKDKGFTDIDNATLVTILMQDQLNINSEEVLINAAVTWATVEAKKKNIPLDHKSLRKVLGPAFEHIRFLNFSLSEFAKGPMQSNLLSNEEKIAIMSCIESQSTTVLDQFQVCKIKERRINSSILQKSVCTVCTFGLEIINTGGSYTLCILDFLFSENVDICGIEIKTQQINQLLLSNTEQTLFNETNTKTESKSYMLHLRRPESKRVLRKVDLAQSKNTNSNILFKFDNISIDSNKCYTFQLQITNENGPKSQLLFARRKQYVPLSTVSNNIYEQCEGVLNGQIIHKLYFVKKQARYSDS